MHERFPGQINVGIQGKDDPPVAEDFEITVYSGRDTTIELPAYDADGTPVEIYIMTEPQGAGQVLKLTEEKLISVNGQRRKVGPVQPALIVTIEALVFQHGIYTCFITAM